MKVFMDRNTIQVELIRFRKNSDFIAVGIFEVGQLFKTNEIRLIAIREVSPPLGDTIPSKNIAFTQVFFFELRKAMQYRSPNAIPDQTGSIIYTRVVFHLARSDNPNSA